MKNILILIATLGTIILGSSCSKDKAPIMVFKTGGTYISFDFEMARHGKAYTVGISAARSSADYPLANFQVKRAYDDEAPLSVEHTLLNSGQSYTYSRDYVVQLRDQVGKEIWYFTITDNNGASKTLSVKFNVQ
jgi:hypothetical protein